ncbi:MAG: RNA polymerase sigma factor [Thermoanaerobaculaceae bacterium]|jgi:RNA polymerase sigma-70 factor (ECF subfamily)|nr:RNA polymerase sigma factor [Thermoanaerobaculaceae bacterium]
MTEVAVPTIDGVVSRTGGGPPTAAGAAAGDRAGMDEATFRAFYERTAPALRAYLQRVSGNRTLADDLLQDSYVRLLRSRFVGTSDDHTRHYLYRIATNLLNDHFRRPRREVAELHESLPAPDLAGGSELRHDLQDALATLTPRERALLWLAHVEGWSHLEIAANQRVKAASVRVMLFRARQRLADLLRARGLAPTGRSGGTS